MDLIKAENYAAAELRVGLTAEFERGISEADILNFARNCGDLSPLHVDSKYAQSTKLGARVVHGAYQMALASAMLGMHLPGRPAFLVSTNAQFHRPLYFPSRVSVRGEITAWEAGSARGNIHVTISELPSWIPTSQIQMGFTLHERAPIARVSTINRGITQCAADRKLVLVSGASGGIGSSLVAKLAKQYAVLALVNRRCLPKELQNDPHISQHKADFSDPEWRPHLEEILGNNCLYGIVHAAWPGVAQGGLLAISARALEQQLAFAVFHTIELARLLANHAGSEGGRFVALGSIFGSQKPKLAVATYSLAKASLEQTVRLLAPELALKQITINAICPSFVATGINRQVNARQVLLEKAAVPLGRLCDTDDILDAIDYVLSSQASFLSGQTIVLSGGQL